MSPVIDPQSRQGEARIAVPYDPRHPPRRFRRGRDRRRLDDRAAAAAKRRAVSDENGNYVYIVNAKNQVERRAVKIGTVDDAGVTIAEGLTGQEAVVLSAGPFLNPGQKVAPQAAGRALDAVETGPGL